MKNEEKIKEYNAMINMMKKLSELYPNNKLYIKLSTITFEEYNKICSDEIDSIALHQSYKNKANINIINESNK